MTEEDRVLKIRTLSSYIPTQVIRRVLQSNPPLSPPETASFPASVLFVDISGFTILADNLAKEKGHEGMEELNRIINSYFEHMISIITNSGGDVVKFAGDAIFAIWPATLLNEDLPQVAIRAASCATELLGTDWSKLPGAVLNGQPVHLKVHIGLGAGEITSMHVGGVLSRCEFVICGDALRQIAKAVDLAKPGQVVASTEGWALIMDRCQGSEVADSGGYMLLEEISDFVPPLVVSPRDFVLKRLLAEKSDEAIDILRKYTPGAVRERIDKGQDWIADLRKVTILFIRLDGLDYTRPHSVRTLNAAMTVVQEILRRYEGAVSRLQVDDKGTVLKAAYGLPPFSHEDDPARGLMAAMDMRPRLQAIGVTPYIGITTGLVFCGTVGSNIRCEYTTVGAPVNLAARLMQNAKEGLLCDSVTYHSAKNRIRMEALGSIKVKGRSEPVAIFRPAGDSDGGQVQLGKMFGRIREKQELEERLNSLTQGQSGILQVIGDVGMGKSRLIAELLQMNQIRRINFVKGNADPISKENFGAWKSIFREIIGLKGKIEDEAKRKEIYDEICTYIDTTEDEMRTKGDGVDPTYASSSQMGAPPGAARAASPSGGSMNPAKTMFAANTTSGRRASTITGRQIQTARRSSILQKPTKLRDSQATEGAEKPGPISPFEGLPIIRPPQTPLSPTGNGGFDLGNILSPPTLSNVPQPPSPSPASINPNGIPGQLPNVSSPVSERSGNRPMGEPGRDVPIMRPMSEIRSQSMKKIGFDPTAGSAGTSSGMTSPKAAHGPGSAIPAHMTGGGKPRRASVWQGVFGPKQVSSSPMKPKGRAGGEGPHEDSGMSVSPSQPALTELQNETGSMHEGLSHQQGGGLGVPDQGFGRTPSSYMSSQPVDLKVLIPLLNPILGTDFPENPSTQSIPENTRTRYVVALLTHIFHASYTKPTLIIIEDVHWMDQCSWNLLLAITRIPKPILTVITSRPLGDSEPPELKKLSPQQLKLTNLGKDDISQLACQTFHIPSEHLPSIVEKAIWDRSQGNPMVAEQLVAFMQESGTVSVSNDQLIIRNAKDINSHPETLGDMITARVDKLTSSQQMAIRVASVIGSKFKFELLKSIYPISRPEAQILDDLQTLVNSGFIEESNNGSREFTFKSKVEQACYMMTPYAQKRRLHYAIATWYETQSGEPQDTHFYELAHHWENADEKTKSVYYYQKAAYAALAQHQNNNAIDYFDKALKLHSDLTDIQTRAKWMVGLIEALFGVGQLNRAHETLEATLRLYERPLPSEMNRLYVSIFQQRALMVAHRFLPSSIFSQEIDKAEKTLASRCYAFLCQIYVRAQKYREAHLCNMYAMDLAELCSGETFDLAIANADAAIIMLAAESHDLCEMYADCAVQLATRLGIPASQIYALLHMSITQASMGNWEKCQDALDEAMEIAEQTLDIPQLDRCRVHSGYMSFFKGDLVEAVGHFTQSQSSSADRYDLLVESNALVGEALVVLIGGQPEKAKTSLAKVGRNIVQMEPNKDLCLKALHLSVTSLCKLHLGEHDVQTAADLALEALSSIETPMSYEFTMSYSCVIEVYLALWDKTSPEKTESRTVLMECATKVLNMLKAYSSGFTLAKPFVLLWSGLQAAFFGNEAKSRQLLESSINTAEDMQYPLVQALASSYLARFHEPVRRLFLPRARQLLDNMGSDYYLKLLPNDGGEGSPRGPNSSNSLANLPRRSLVD